MDIFSLLLYPVKKDMANVSIILRPIYLLVVLSLTLSGVSCSKNLAGSQSLPLRQTKEVVAANRETGGSDLTSVEVRQLLQEHNRVRAEVGVGALVWSESLALHARQWAEHLADSGCRMEHRPAQGPWRGMYGENLFMGTAGYYGVVDAVRGWESEKRFFKGGSLTLSNWQPAGHYTQLVWRHTQKLGCGKALCQGNILLVCNYDPPGNVLSEMPY